MTAVLGFGLSLGQFICDQGFQPLIAGEAENVVNAVGLAPGHQVLAAEARIRPKPDVDVRPALPDLRDDQGDLFLGAGRGVDVRGPEFRQQQLPAAENIKRQIAVAFVIAVKEPALLIAVDGIVGRVEVKDNALRRGCVGLEKEADEQPFHRALVHAQLAIAVFIGLWRVLKPVQRGLPRQHSAIGAARLSFPETRPRTGSWRSSS